MSRLFALAAALLFVAANAQAAPCRDAQGHFVKCATATSAAAQSGRCRDTKGHFTKCTTPGTAPAAASPAPAPSATPSNAPSASLPRSTSMATAAPALGAHHPNCKKGKPCGNSCIAQDKVCHK